MMGQPITSVTEHKYLGVELDSKLTWNEHISAIITGKVNSSRVPSGMVAQKNRKNRKLYIKKEKNRKINSTFVNKDSLLAPHQGYNRGYKSSAFTFAGFSSTFAA